jgi:hypothetical protein
VSEAVHSPARPVERLGIRNCLATRVVPAIDPEQHPVGTVSIVSELLASRHVQRRAFGGTKVC